MTTAKKRIEIPAYRKVSGMNTPKPLTDPPKKHYSSGDAAKAQEVKDKYAAPSSTAAATKGMTQAQAAAYYAEKRKNK